MGDLPKLHLFCPVLEKMFHDDRLVNDELPDIANTKGSGRKTIFGKFEDDS